MMEYNKETKTLSICSEYFGMPQVFDVVSHHTGRTIRFTIDEKAFYENEGWDGECCYYIPAPGQEQTNVQRAYIYHAW
jgi:hypothetical protein